MYLNRFSDELLTNDSRRSDLSVEISQEISTDNMNAVLELNENDLRARRGNQLNYGKLRNELSHVLTNPETDSIVKLIINICQKHQD